MKRILASSMLVMLCSLAAFADIAPRRTPTPAPKASPVSSHMSIRMDWNTKVATLSIPRSQLQELRAQIDQIESDGDSTAASAGSFSQTQTIVSGAFISLGGLWLVRSGKSASRSARPLLVLALVGVIASAATLVYANAGPPNNLRTISSTLFDKKVFGYWPTARGKVDLVVSDSQVIELRVPAPKNWPHDKESDKNEE